MYQVYGLKNILYYHVGSPRYRSESRWGEVFPTLDACQRACEALKLKHGVAFLNISPRKVEHPQENNFDNPDES